MKPILAFKTDKKERKNFFASDFGKLGVDIHLQLQGVEPSNPTKYTDALKWGAGKGVELEMVKTLKFNKVISESYDQETQESTKIERKGVVISMKFDALAEDAMVEADELGLPQKAQIKLNKGEPLEIKSINNKNAFDIKDYIEGNPRENYVGQLAMYMDALGKERGHLFCSTIDGLHTFWFVVEKQVDGTYKAGNTIVDIQKEYARFAEIWTNKDKEPNWNEVPYKMPLSEIQWDTISNSKISAARNNQAVIGYPDSWKILYSPYKDLIVEKQGQHLGYDEAELAIIHAATAGYSSKKNAKNAPKTADEN